MQLRGAELAALARLRERFLTGTALGGAYWRDEAELALYDSTFAERIGWKWDAVLEDLSLRAWQPRSRHLLDFGCGSGVAHRRVLAKWPQFESLALVDVSTIAMRYAAKRAGEEFPNVKVQTSVPASIPPGTLLLVSHVINELSPAARAELLALARRVDEIIWVESGTHADSRALIAVREELRADFAIIAPCPHAAQCGMLAPENARHWCHHFGRVPSAVSQDAGWSQFSRELGIDLTALPYSYLVLSRPPAAVPAGNSRVIGRPREAKGRMEILTCREEGVRDLTLQKRDAPALFKALQKDRADTLQQWEVSERKVNAPAENPTPEPPPLPFS